MQSDVCVWLSLKEQQQQQKSNTTTTVNPSAPGNMNETMRPGKHWLQVVIQCLLHPTYRPGASSDIFVRLGYPDSKEAFNSQF